MSKTLAMVRRRLNSFNPTLRKVPPEILIMVASNLKINAALVTKATHVCHHWRVTLLSCPNLWTHLDFLRVSQATSFLERSRLLPIHIDLTRTLSSRSLVELLCFHSERVYALKISHFDGLHKLFRRPLTSLRTLEITLPDRTYPVGLAMRSTAREFPALTSLTIKDNCDAFDLRGSRITHLHVITPMLGIRIRTKALLNLFRSCVLLEELEIENEEWLESDSVLLPDDEVIPLPHLRSFTQTPHCGRHGTEILDSLSLLPSCSVVLRCVGSYTKDYPPLSLPNTRNTPYFTNVKRARVTYGGMYIKASVTLNLVNDEGARFSAITESVWPDTDLFKQEPTRAVRTKLSIPGAETLCVDGNRYVSLRSYKHLTTLILSGPVVRLYLELLSEPDGWSVFESLHALVLFVGLANLARHLLDAAQIRAKAGSPFRTITFAYPSVLAQRHLAILERLRECVEWVELLLGDDALDWSLDKYFLDGL